MPHRPRPRANISHGYSPTIRTRAARLARVLKAYIDAYGGTCGVFLDFCSLHQKGPAGEQRSDAEGELFGFALKCLSDWYSHPNTMVLKATKMPEGYPNGFSCASGTTPNTADYYAGDDLRMCSHACVCASRAMTRRGSRRVLCQYGGRCFKESSVANLVKNFNLCLDLGKLSDEAAGPRLWDTIIEQCRAGRAPPLTPADFMAELEGKSFTSRKADLPTVGGLYKAAFDRRFKTATTLLYVALHWGDEEVESLSKVIASGALAQLAHLNLGGNKIGDAGVTALADACGRGQWRHSKRFLWTTQSTQNSRRHVRRVAFHSGEHAIRALGRSARLGCAHGDEGGPGKRVFTLATVPCYVPN
jgi:hypothetical protein